MDAARHSRSNLLARRKDFRREPILPASSCSFALTSAPTATCWSRSSAAMTGRNCRSSPRTGSMTRSGWSAMSSSSVWPPAGCQRLPACVPARCSAAARRELPDLISGEQARLLDVLGHAEIFGLRLHVGKRRYFLLFSAAEDGSIDTDNCHAHRCAPAMRCHRRRNCLPRQPCKTRSPSASANVSIGFRQARRPTRWR